MRRYRFQSPNTTTTSHLPLTDLVDVCRIVLRAIHSATGQATCSLVRFAIKLIGLVRTVLARVFFFFININTL